MLDPDMIKTIFEVWYSLSNTKKIQSRTVFDRIPKERLSSESLQDPNVKSQVEQLGYYDSAMKLPENWIEALNFLAGLGYLEKRDDVIYHIAYFYEAYPYEPYISPFGWVGVTNSNKFVMSCVNVDSRHIKIFTETADELKRQISNNIHRHITRFEYGITFYYDTIVYEIKDKYFDAIALSFSLTEPKLLVFSCEPYVTSDGKTDKKRIKNTSQLDSEIFLNGSDEFDKIMEIPQWKEKSKGIIIQDDKAYFLVNKREDIPTENRFFKMPNIFDEGVASKENFLSRIFEDAIAEYLSSNYGYQTKCRIKPTYLHPREIDIFAEKGVDPKDITICECKLRFNESPLTLNEIEYFHQKTLKIIENESKRGTVKFHFQFVSNTDKLEEGLEEFAKMNKIEIKRSHCQITGQKGQTGKLLK